MDTKQTERFAAGLERHVAEEEEILKKYQHLVGLLKAGAAGLLVRAIFLDEKQHHHVLSEMAKELRSLAERNPIIPDRSRADILKMVEELIQHEEANIENCRALKEQLSEPENDLFAAVLEAVMCDSEKHKRLLLALDEVLAGR
jgi:hypothetical protein